MKINPRGLIPALQHGDWGCYESSVLMEYLEDLGFGQSLLGSDPKARANSRLWSDHVSRPPLMALQILLTEDGNR
jgi:glutathione S-transferase